MKHLLRYAVASLLAVGTLAAQGKFSGYMFGDYYYNITRPAVAQANAASLAGVKSYQAFAFRRIYFTYDNDISDKFTSRFRLEADQTALAGTKILPVVKDAYLKWKNAFLNGDLIFGIQPTTAFEISENWWGYRSLEKTIIDLRGAIPSRDLGIALRGKITDDGAYNYWFMVSNGDGNSPATTKYKRYALNLQAKPDNNWTVTLNGDYRARTSIADPTNATGTLSNDVFTSSLFAGFKEQGKYSVGLEAFMSSIFNGQPDVSNPPQLKSKTQIGFSVFGNYTLQDDLALVARFDYWDPNNDSNVKGDSRNYIIAGLSWMPDKNVSIIPNFTFETYEAPTGGTAPDAALTGRITFYYIFL